MASTRLTETKPAPTDEGQDQKPSDIGPTEDQVDMGGTIGQHIDNKGTKVEDEAGTGQIDSSGG